EHERAPIAVCRDDFMDGRLGAPHEATPLADQPPEEVSVFTTAAELPPEHRLGVENGAPQKHVSRARGGPLEQLAGPVRRSLIELPAYHPLGRNRLVGRQ